MLELKLMLVEDDEFLRERLERILKREIRTVKSYTQPSEALVDIHEFIPDVIVTDIKMPGMSGLEMIKIIRQSFPDIPVIVASAFSDSEFFMDAIKLKVENYVIKPIDIEELLQTIQSIADNLTIKKQLIENESLLKQYKHIVDLSANIVITDKEGTITYVNEHFCELSGYSREELIGHTHRAIRHPDTRKSFYKELWEHILAKNIWQGIIKNRAKDGHDFYGDTTIAPILNASGEIIEFITIKIDISDLMTSKKQLQSDIITDRLTELPNRIKLQEDFHKFKDYTMLLLDIDRFKEVNLLFGIHFGDSVLKYFAKELKNIFSYDAVEAYRIASDEYVVLCSGDKRQKFKKTAQDFKERIALSPLVYENISFEVDFSCALLYTDDLALNPIELLQGTVSEAKKTKRFLLEHNKLEMIQKQYEENFQWISKIKDGLHENRIEIYFQPLYDVKENQVTKFESLIRLIDCEGNVVSPGLFLPAAKRSRYYRELTYVVISKACETFAKKPYNFSINLSIEDLTDEETVDFLIATVSRYELEDKIIVEVLESEGIDNFYAIQTIFERLSEAGLRIAIDDFGSGYSNYAYIINLPVSFLKIDGSLIKNIVKDKASRIIVQSIVMFAHELGMQVIAEFVSDEDIFDVVRDLGIDFAQGYHIGEPQSFPDDSFKTDGE